MGQVFAEGTAKRGVIVPARHIAQLPGTPYTYPEYSLMYELSSFTGTEPKMVGGDVCYILLPCFAKVYGYRPTTVAGYDANKDQYALPSSTFLCVDETDTDTDLVLSYYYISGATHRRADIVTMAKIDHQSGDTGGPYYTAVSTNTSGTSRKLAPGTEASDAITGGNQGAKQITVAGDKTATYPANTRVRINGSTGNDGIYTVASVAYTTETTITLDEALPHATMDGTVYVATTLLVMSVAGDPVVDETVVRMTSSGAPYNWTITAYLDGDFSSDIAVDDTIVISGYATIGGDYAVTGVSYTGGQTQVNFQKTDYAHSINTFTITDSDSGTKTIHVDGDQTTSGDLEDGGSITVWGSTDLDGLYTINGSPTYDATDDETDIVVSEAVPSTATPDGSLQAAGTAEIYNAMGGAVAFDMPLTARYLAAYYDVENDVAKVAHLPTDNTKYSDVREGLVQDRAYWQSTLMQGTQYDGGSPWPNLHVVRIDTTLMPYGSSLVRWANYGVVAEILVRHPVTGELYQGFVDWSGDPHSNSSYALLRPNASADATDLTIALPWRAASDYDEPLTTLIADRKDFSWTTVT